MFLRLSTKSLTNRKGSVLLTLLAMTVSIAVLLGVEHIRQQAKSSFSSTVSGVDLIVGGRSSRLNLLLYSVFRIGSPTSNISWSVYQDIAESPRVKWAIPISLGDSHEGYPVIGTSDSYFEHFKYGQKKPLEFQAGGPFRQKYDVVVGAKVARQLNYQIGDRLVVAHGLGRISFTEHRDSPFKISGILKATGTPVDQSLHVSLEALEAIHQPPGNRADAQPQSITAMMLGLKSRLSIFQVQRQINQHKAEPLMAILPGVALSELWQVMAILESTLRLVSIFVLVAALFGLSAMLLASTRERRQEIQLLRAVGASPLYIFLLIEIEATLICLLSMLLASAILITGLYFYSELLSSDFGLQVSTNIFSAQSGLMLLLILAATLIMAAIPSFSAYRQASGS